MGYYIDSHCHLHPTYFQDEEIPRIIENAAVEGVKKVISCASDPMYFSNVMDSYIPDKLFATLGLQPTEAKDHVNALSISKTLENYSTNDIKERLKGIGEIGLDYYWVKEDALKQRQEELFISSMTLAAELNLPIIIHTRKAEEDSLNFLEKYAQTPVLLHSFEGNLEQINRAKDLGYLVSIPTNVLIRKNRRKVATRVGLDNMILETDSPYCGPSQEHFPNTPATIPIAAKKIAQLLEISTEEVRDQTTKNAEKFYRI